ncbi:hypothetical protein Dsin_026405 [Dipteronia sinensis]|uniref:U1-type domain-containing protein n=1 Tax=Dipteronia sinensis TaxID=43782 RepID=A0AAD9ZXH2_9ROSI|nr:hypothetical protein Dsin_026405 [Dipteronia sinensis]
MDYSAAEQQQYQQQQQQQYQHQQYQPDQPQSQSYDPSQYQAYYASYSNQQQYQYYPSYDYANTTASSSSSYHPHQYHPESASIHPPGVPVTPDPTQSQNYENASYYPQHRQSNLSQYPGNFDAAQMTVHPPIGQSAHRGGGRKGGRPFRGGGRGHGRGRGRGGGRYGPPHSGVPNSAPSASIPGQATLTEPALVPAAPRMAWCKICRVDCNTPEILEQHKNGKRHKKNLQTHAELQNLNKVITGQQNVQLPNPEVQTEVFLPEKVDGSGEKQLTQESVPSQAPAYNDRNETELPNNTVEKIEVNTVDSAEDPQRKTRDQFVARGRGLKRRMRGGRGGKYMRTSEGSRRPVEPPKPKEVIPFICELCNVKCESQVVFNSHLVGKKHIANVKRFHGHRALYGEAGLQALYPPNLNASSSSVTPQVQQGVNDPQVLLAQLLTYVLAQAQTPGLLAAQVPGLAAAAAPMLASSQETQYQFDSQTQGPLVISEAENKIVTLEAEGQPESITSKPQVEAEGQPESITSKPEVSASVSIDTNASLPQDNPVIASLEKPDDHAEQDLSADMSIQCNNPDNAALENKEQDPGSETEVDPDEDSELEH